MGYWNVNFTDGTSDDFGADITVIVESDFDGFVDLKDDIGRVVVLIPKRQIKYLEYIED